MLVLVQYNRINFMNPSPIHLLLLLLCFINTFGNGRLCHTGTIILDFLVRGGARECLFIIIGDYTGGGINHLSACVEMLDYMYGTVSLLKAGLP